MTDFATLLVCFRSGQIETRDMQERMSADPEFAAFCKRAMNQPEGLKV